MNDPRIVAESNFTDGATETVVGSREFKSIARTSSPGNQEQKHEGHPVRGHSDELQVCESLQEALESSGVPGSLSNGQFVQQVYGNVLDRAPDAAGLAYWTDRLSRGMTRGQLMIGFSESPEFIARVGVAP